MSVHQPLPLAPSARPGCASHDPSLWDADPRDAFGASRSALAKEICATECPMSVVLACLRHAVEAGETAGIWGGLDPGERAALGARSAPISA